MIRKFTPIFCLFFIVQFCFGQLTLENGISNYAINFDNSKTGINAGSFNGTGLNNPPNEGQLNGNAWAISGFSNGTHNFGQINTSGDFARGQSNGGVSSGGLYSFNVGSNNKAMGIQPTGSDWTPGAICLKIVNNQNTSVEHLDLNYTLYIRNDQNRANTFNFAYSLDNVNYTSVSSAGITSPSNASSNPDWVPTSRSISLSALDLSPGASLYLRWSGGDAGGSGSRDEFALDDILLATSGQTADCVDPTSQTTNLNFGTTTANSIAGSFSNHSADKYLVIRSTSSTLNQTPTDGILYNPGSNFGNGEVVQYSNNTSFIASGLSPTTTYYFYVFAANDNCNGGPNYLASNPLTRNQTTTADQNSDYYAVVNGQTCAELKTVLYNLIKGHTVYSYGALWSIYQETDDHLNDAGTATIVWDMYSDNPTAGENEFTFITEQCGTYSGEGDCYNREHSFPKSWWGGSTTVPQYTDLFVVVPVDGWINGIRSNNPYGVVQAGAETRITNNGSKLGPSALSIPGYGGNVFEPIDAYKGDFARNYFYMMTRYENNIASWENSTNESDAVLDGTSYPGLEQWAIDMLIDWHNSDPVSQKEILRNDEIFSYQQNRNPFIDHPEYVALIWQSCSGQDNESPTAPTNLVATNTTATSTLLNWNLSTDNVGVNNYNIYQNGTLITTVSGSISSEEVNGLSANTSYSFFVTAKDAAGNESLSSNSISITTDAAADIQAPSAPTNLTANNVSETNVSLNWNASNDNVGVSGYNIYQNGEIVISSIGTNVTLTNLVESTTYLYYVTAFDVAGNESSNSNTISITTDTPVDAQAPSIPTNLSVSNVTETNATLTWNVSNDNVGVVGYNIYQDGNVISTSSVNSIELTTLLPATTYLFNVSAFDAAGNESSISSTVSVTTDTPSGGSTVLHEGYFENGWDNWQDGGSDCARYSGPRSPEGNYSIRLRDNSGTQSAMTSESFDLTSFTNVEVTFSYYVNSFENVENFFLRYFNGSSWTTVADYIRGTAFNNGTLYTTSVILNASEYNFASNARFRFQADASGNGDQVYIDAVIIVGDPQSNGLLVAQENQPQFPEVNSQIMTVPTRPLSIPLKKIEVKKDGILVFPNPASDYIKLKGLNLGSEIKELEIYSVLGQRMLSLNKLKSKEIQELNISDFKNGMYVIRIKHIDNRMESISFIKQ